MEYINAREYCELNGITEETLGIDGEVDDMMEIDIIAEKYLKSHNINWREDTNDTLPYDFDLLWDIKTKLQLVTQYLNAKQKVKDIEEVCQSHNMDINKLIEEIQKA